MHDYEAVLAVDGLDLDDDALVEDVFEMFSGGGFPAEVDGWVTVTAIDRAPTSADMLMRAVARLRKRGVTVTDVDLDLVSVSDIANRVDRHRESVRLLVDGLRGPGGFPRPAGIVGRGQKVWAWADVFGWMLANEVGLPDDLPHPVERKVAATVQHLLGAPDRQSLEQMLFELPSAATVAHWIRRGRPAPSAVEDVLVVEAKAGPGSVLGSDKPLVSPDLWLVVDRHGMADDDLWQWLNIVTPGASFERSSDLGVYFGWPARDDEEQKA